MNHDLAKRNLNETKGILLLKQVISVQQRLAKIAILSGCLIISFSNFPSYNNRMINNNKIPNISGSVGKLKAI